MQLVYIEWDDASTVDAETGWVWREGAPPAEPRIFRQVGFITELTDRHIVLTCAYDESQMAPRSRIPLGMVRRMVRIDIEASPASTSTPIH